MTGKFIEAADATWDKFVVEKNYDFYHLKDYSQLESTIVGGTPMAYLLQIGTDEILIPLIIRIIPEHLKPAGETYLDAASPFGHPGILTNENFDLTKLNKFMECFNKDCLEYNLITSFIRLNPLQNPYLLQHTPYLQQVFHGFTISFDLNKSQKDLFDAFSSNHLRNIKKLKSLNYHTIIDDWDEYSEFQALYAETMTRLEAIDYFFFSPHYFAELKSILKDNLHLFIVKDENGVTCAGCLFTCMNGVVQYHLAGTKSSHLQHSPSKLLIYEGIKWAQSLGMKVLHFGGGGPTLYQYKKGFSSDENRFTTLRFIHSPELYKKINKSSQNEAASETDFFPLYRKNTQELV